MNAPGDGTIRKCVQKPELRSVLGRHANNLQFCLEQRCQARKSEIFPLSFSNFSIHTWLKTKNVKLHLLFVRPSICPTYTEFSHPVQVQYSQCNDSWWKDPPSPTAANVFLQPNVEINKDQIIASAGAFLRRVNSFLRISRVCRESVSLSECDSKDLSPAGATYENTLYKTEIQVPAMSAQERNGSFTIQ